MYFFKNLFLLFLLEVRIGLGIIFRFLSAILCVWRGRDDLAIRPDIYLFIYLFIYCFYRASVYGTVQIKNENKSAIL